MHKNFEWPVPAYYQLPQGEEFSGHEPAIVFLMDGTRISGLLSRFLPTHGVIEFLHDKGRTNVDIALSEIRMLRLTRPLLLKQRGSAELESRGGGAPNIPEKLPFQVEFASGDPLAGETIGFDVQGAGLFLYVATYGDAVIRHFIPATSIKARRIGKRIGEILVDEGVVNATQLGSGLARQRELREQKIGDIFATNRVLSSDQLHAALERQKAAPVVRLGEALVEMKLISPEQLEEALGKQKQNRKRPLGEILLDMGYLNQNDLYRALSQKLGIPCVDLTQFRIDPAAIKLVPASLAREANVIPLCSDAGSLVLAMENPLEAGPLERVRFVTQMPVIPVIASPKDISLAIGAHYGDALGDKKIDELANQLRTEVRAESSLSEEMIKETDSTLVRLVNKMILDAHGTGASDIHVESNAGRKNVMVRFRKDGVLAEYLQLPSGFCGAIVSRLKIMANLDISEKRRAQDGRINFEHFGPAKVELRMAVIPTHDGLEDVVLRVLSAGEPLPMAKLGLRTEVHDALRKLLEVPHGLVLAVGPTGSGKTTTLHSLIGVLNRPELKIWTAEDPIEISQTGLRQVQVNARIGWTFAAAMRAFLRCDPDVIMVGEMRDQETAAIAVEASLTGHLVFSTLHTNSAADTIARLLDMGLDPFSFADSLLAVLAQRLARRLCRKCRGSRPATDAEVHTLAAEYCHDSDLRSGDVIDRLRRQHGGPLTIYEARGCPECRNTGYLGRLGLHELLVTNPEIRRLMQQRATVSELRAAAARAGMRTLRQDGIEKCLAGDTDLHEVRAVAG
jgi:type II secretory ATPase GspE/PulE/Tfp pilus assembly ATPase PilB-like protein